MKIFTHNFIGKIGAMLAALAFLWCLPAMGQVIKGSMSGTVTDPQGAVVGGAQIKATQVDTGAVFTTTSDSSGLFRINLIPAGTYKVEISSKGFTTAVQNNVQVTAGADMGLGSLKLALGEPSTTVEVVGGEAPLIETSQAQVTNTFSGTTLQTFSGIQENQGLDNLALFVPGVASSRDANFSNTNGGQGFSSNGLRGRNNDQEIDGQNNNDNSVTGPALFVTDPNFVQQYVIITNNFGAEYGRNAGSVVNIITSSGTNNWHGSVFGNENNSILNGMPADEKVTINPATDKPLTSPPRANDEFSGGTIGGPWIKNKLFFFGGFDNEIVGTSSSFVSTSITPTPAGLATLAGCFPSGLANIAVQNLTLFGPYGVKGGNPTPVPASIVSDMGIPGCPGVQGGTVSRELPTPNHSYDFLIREDWQVGPNDTISGRYLYNRSDPLNATVGQSAAAGYSFNVPGLSQITLLSWTHNISSRMVNELRLGFDRLNVEFGGNTIGNTIPTTGNINNALTSISFLSTADLGFGVPSGFPQGRFSNTWQVQDNWNYVLGKHQLKAGVNYTHEQAPSTFLPNVNATYTFGSFNDYITDIPTGPNTNVGFTAGDPEIGFKEDDVFLYAGDDWKIKSNLTLNLGLTWSYFSQPENLLNQLDTQNENGPNPMFNPALPLSERVFPYTPVYLYTIGPSFGFAYSPQWGGFLTGNGKTVIRGGFRRSYDPPNLNIFSNNYGTAPNTLSVVLPGSAVPLNPTGTTVQALLNPSVPLGKLDPRSLPELFQPTTFRPDAVNSWSLGFEREMGRHAAFEARYVGNHGNNLFQNINGNPYLGGPAGIAVNGFGGLADAFPNEVPAGITPCATPLFPAAAGRVNCDQGVELLRTNGGFSNYDALQTNFRATNLFNQLTMTASYTYSKTLDNSAEIFNGFGAGATTSLPQNPFNGQGAEYSISGLNFPNNFSVQLTEALPFFKEQHGFLGHLLGGWSGALSYIFVSGQPYTPVQLFSADLSNLGATGNDPFDLNFQPAFNNGVGNARPFLGNPSAPANAVGMFAGDACALTAVLTSGSVVAPSCGLPAKQLVSLNALNQAPSFTGSAIPVTNQQVRFIANGGIADQIFGTPYGNVPRNSLVDSPTNFGNVSIYKNFKINERASFEFHVTMLNAFNHSNWNGVVPFIENAGLEQTGAFGAGFALPNQDIDQANGLTNEIPGQTLNATRRVYFGGKITF